MKLLKFFAFAFVPVLFSCQVQKGWVYKPNKYTPTEKSEQKIYVPTFEDERNEENKNAILMYYIPIVPFGWQNMHTPETSMSHLTSSAWLNYDPKVSFAKALIEELKRGSHFKEVEYTESIVDSCYRIQGRIINTDYKSKMFSYCLSFYGPLLWWIGLPAGTFKNELEIELTCYGPDNNVFLQRSYHPTTIKKTTWIYKQKSDFEYSTLLKSAYSEFIRDFNSAIKNKQNSSKIKVQ